MASFRWVCAATMATVLPSLAAGKDFAHQGQKALATNDLNQAIISFSKAIQANPMDAASYRGRGEAYLKLGKLDQALADLNESIRLAPKDAAAQIWRAHAWIRAGRNREAVADATAGLQLDGNYAGAYCARGSVHLARLLPASRHETQLELGPNVHDNARSVLFSQ